MPTYQELKQQADKLFEEAEALRQKEIRGVIEQIKGLMSEYGITASDLGTSRRKRSGAKTVAAKYRGPNGETWSGRGRQPTWLAEWVAKGKKKEDFLI